MADTATSPSIHEIFYRDIERNINTVVKVDDDDPAVVEQELTEYILTSQLEGHFTDALETILDTEHAQTDDVGFWISGFFGSGKSHFMKILGYLLENRSFDDMSAADIFKSRSEDELLNGAVDAVTTKFDSEVLMFQIGAKADAAGSDSITDIIHREFNSARGYASTPWVAQMEQELEARGIYEEFIEAIEEHTGEAWEESRKDAFFLQAAMETALVEVSEEFDTEKQAATAIGNVQEDILITPSTLAKDIVEHVEQRETETEGQCRYFVFIDEVSQFVGGDQEKLLTLQSIVEQFEQHGDGKLFLGVTSQEQLQELVPGILEQDEEVNKVIDRFPHQFDLISENLDKVVRERILRKQGEYTGKIGDLYDQHAGILSARYKLDSGRDLKTINKETFVSCYPFLPYQLDILPDIFAALRGRGSEDKLTGRERTLIDVTQSVLEDPELLYNEELGALVTLDMIFDEISGEIPDSDVSSIKEADPRDADTEMAQRVLKALYLLQQLDWIPNTAENIATTLQPQIGPMSELKEAVGRTLEALLDAGYVGRSEEGYRFLRETERKLENEIKGVEVGIGDIKRKSKRFLDDVLDTAGRVNYQGQSFTLNLQVDGEEFNSGGYIDIKTYSPVYQYDTDVDIPRLKTQSHNEADTVYWIADEEPAGDLVSDIKTIQQTETVIREKRRESLSAEEQEAVQQKQKDLNRLQNEVERTLKRSFQEGTLIYRGDITQLDVTDTTLQSIIADPAREAIPRVFHALDDGLATVKDRHVEQIFGDLEESSNPAVFSELGIVEDGSLIMGARIVEEVQEQITHREQAGKDRTGQVLIDYFEQPPYGWSRDVIRLAAAVLFRNGSIVPAYKEQTYESYTDDGAQDLFTQVSRFKQTTFDERETVDTQTRTEAQQLLDVVFDRKVKAVDQEINQAILEEANEWVATLDGIVPRLQRVEFPLIAEVEDFRTLLRNLKQQPTSAKRIKQFVDHEAKLKEQAQTVKSVVRFCDTEVDRDHLEEYETIQQFITTEWDQLTEAAKDYPELITIDEGARKAANRVASNLDTDGVIENWGAITTDYQNAAQAYAKSYESLYNRRNEEYNKAIRQVRDYGDGRVDEQTITMAISELQDRRGQESMSLTIADREHINPDPALDRLIEHIRTVDSYIEIAKDSIDEAVEAEDDITQEIIELDAIFGSVTVTDPEDLDEPVKKLRTKVAEKLNEADEVEVRFS